MRAKELKYIVTFHTTTGAMAMEKICKEQGLAGRLIPVPREISAGCGMCWAVSVAQKEPIIELLKQETLNVDGTYELMV